MANETFKLPPLGYTEARKPQRVEQAFERVVARFDFEQARLHMLEVGWVWSTEGGVGVTPYTPTVEQMKVWVAELFRQLQAPDSTCRSGGFSVTWARVDDSGMEEEVSVSFKPKTYQEVSEYV